jgi:plasmid stability protein
MPNRNLTISLPEELIKKTKVRAARDGKSMNQLIREAIEQRLRQQSGYSTAMKRQQAMLEKGFDLGTEGEIGFARDELHGR